MKLFIIGAAGSGKTTLASKLSKELHLITVNLDDLFWVNSINTYGIKRNKF